MEKNEKNPPPAEDGMAGHSAGGEETGFGKTDSNSNGARERFRSSGACTIIWRRLYYWGPVGAGSTSPFFGWLFLVTIMITCDGQGGRGLGDEGLLTVGSGGLTGLVCCIGL